MNEYVSIGNSKLSKNDKFVTSKTKFVYFLTVLSFFMKLRLNVQLIVFFLMFSFQKISSMRLKNDTTQILKLF